MFELFDAFLQEEPNFSLGYSLISRNLRTFANGIRRKQTKKGVTYGYIGYRISVLPRTGNTEI